MTGLKKLTIKMYILRTKINKIQIKHMKNKKM